jgi:hypothetical protein
MFDACDLGQQGVVGAICVAYGGGVLGTDVFLE